MSAVCGKPPSPDRFAVYLSPQAGRGGARGAWVRGLAPSCLRSRYECGSASPLRRQDLDQLALGGVDLRMLAVPLDGHVLELDAELLVVVDHLAHPRPGQGVQVGLPGVVGEFLALFR